MTAPLSPTARPILMSAPMIRALLAGTKTQTRRIVKPQPPAEAKCAGVIQSHNESDGLWSWLDSTDIMDASCIGDDFRCPYGVPGDLLWVRETWARNQNQISDDRMDPSVRYRADGEDRALDNGDELPWRPSIHMPRKHSRLTLRITDVRVERLQNISEADARAEGVLYVPGHGEITPAELKIEPGYSNYLNCRLGYWELWDRINGAGSRAANPWAWALTFTVDKRNVDDVLRDARAA